MDVQMQMSETDNKKVCMLLGGKAQGAVVFNDFDAFVAFTKDCLEYAFEITPIPKTVTDPFSDKDKT